MSVVFLECATFLEMINVCNCGFPDLKHHRECRQEQTNRHICCKTCHTHEHGSHLIYVRAFQEGALGEAGNTDWELCVEAIVCCNLYHFVRALPRSWWIEQARKHGVGRGDSKGYIYPNSPSRNTDRSDRPRSGSKRTVQKDEDEEPQGLAAWMKNR